MRPVVSRVEPRDIVRSTHDVVRLGGLVSAGCVAYLRLHAGSTRALSRLQGVDSVPRRADVSPLIRGRTTSYVERTTACLLPRSQPTISEVPPNRQLMTRLTRFGGRAMTLRTSPFASHSWMRSDAIAAAMAVSSSMSGETSTRSRTLPFTCTTRVTV